MFDTARNNEDLTRLKRHDLITKLNIQPTLNYLKKVVRVLMAVPHEFPIQLHNANVVAIVVTHDPRCPMIRKGREAFGKIDLVHQ